ncbi:MAG: threonine/serine dehydratase [Rhodospirillaceae bacterium]|jgi:threonine dehydratase|nr:threonine/serine dehydratase [Rhodospirillaceae bacterium]MBT5242043.1 threonine/serine dehydratase [Rhodospirillaceae bacterium]MBT5565768.1 threonine/serine dehydratase [Rhodospirillaceae bacterium]MBT6088505.1 threonine/serine dehydratase [Rhodospirillaceae bacterium]
MTLIPTPNDIRDAATRIAASVKKTPVLTSQDLDGQTGGRIFLKAECLQKTGSFKIRGATNKLMQLSESERAAGVVAWSTGNHAQGVAAAAKALNISAKIVMPSDAPQTKLDGTRSYGAEVVFYDRTTDDREDIGRRIAQEEGRIVVPPYDDFDIICGQGTAGLELVDQVSELGFALDDVLVPASGGGLLAGVSLAVHDRFPDARIFVVEPQSFDDHQRSLGSGQRETNTQRAGSICDALLAPAPGTLTWQVNRTHLTGGYAVSDDDVLDAIAFAYRAFDVRLEPGGAITLAALLSGHHNAKGRNVALILSGGNVDDDTFNRALARLPTNE